MPSNIPKFQQQEEALWHVESALGDFISGDSALDTSKISNWSDLSSSEQSAIRSYGSEKRLVYRANLEKVYTLTPKSSSGSMLDLQEKLNAASPEKFQSLMTDNEFGVKGKVATVPVKDIIPSQYGEDIFNDSSKENLSLLKKKQISKRTKDLAPIVIDKGGVIIDGNHRYAAALQNGDKDILVIQKGTGSFSKKQLESVKNWKDEKVVHSIKKTTGKVGDTLADKYVARGITLLRAAEGDANDAAKIFDQVNRKIVRNIQSANFDTMTKRGLQKLERAIEKDLAKYYKTDLPNELRISAAAAIKSEVEWNLKVLTGEQAADLLIPKNRGIVKRTATKTYQGKRMSTWVNREFNHSQKKINQILTSGFVKSTPKSEIEDAISKLSNRSRRDVRTIVRSSFMHNATEAKETVFGLNPDIVEGAVWISVLDNRTTPLLCGVRDGKLWDNDRNPIGHDLPWGAGPGRLHWNCRSMSVPKLVGVPVSGTRASVDAGADYVSGDNTTRTGRVRKLSKRATEKGTYKVEEHTMQTKYEGWLRGQSRTNIDFASNVLGKENARNFRDGKVTLSQLGLESPVARPLNRNSL